MGTMVLNILFLGKDTFFSKIDDNEINKQKKVRTFANRFQKKNKYIRDGFNRSIDVSRIDAGNLCDW
ncbi:hypothetical protein CAPN008_00440 [Capnocytophaga canis]|nr:hypothetical protein CAPN008_00440 [Capnocytophaga canis]